MNRWTALKVLAPMLALVAAMAPATASAIGGPAGGFVLPPGTTASFTGIDFGACNNLGWGYNLNLGPDLVQATRQGDCVNHMPAPNVTIGPFATPTTLRVFLKDITCTATYYSDGTPFDHVIISGSNPYLLRFADAGGFCERKTTVANDFTLYNLKVTLTLTDLCKDQDMDSQLDLQCEQQGQNGGAHDGDGSAGFANREDAAPAPAQPLKATAAVQHSTAKVSSGEVGHANHADSQGQANNGNHNS